MANIARMDQEKRTVEVNRLSLVRTLETNLKSHIAAYKAAVKGYRDAAMEKLRHERERAAEKLEKQMELALSTINDFDEDNPTDTPDYLTLVREVSIRMEVPRNYAAEYEAAIDMAKWDVRETLELTHAEFQCFVRDKWDWKRSFLEVTGMYSKPL